MLGSNLDTVNELINDLNDLKSSFKNNHIKLFFSKKLLLFGAGGVGKTHSLCSIVKLNIDRKIPGFIFYGQYFNSESPENTILERLNIKDVEFDDFLLFEYNW